jgi:hypothetical protein
MLGIRDCYKHLAPMERSSQIASHIYRIVSQRLGIPSIDAPHVIQLVAEAKLIAAAKPHLDQMRQRGYGIPQTVYERILRDVGERCCPIGEQQAALIRGCSATDAHALPTN